MKTSYISLLAALLAPLTASATLIHAEFDWTGVNGYRVHAPFTYDDRFSDIVVYDGAGGRGLLYLAVDVFSPAGDLLQSVVNRDAFGSPYGYLHFRYNPDTGIISLDIGSDPGYFLVGGALPGIRADFRLLEDDYESPEIPIIDHGGNYTIRTVGVPDGGNTALLMGATLVGLLGLHLLAKRHHV